MNKYDKYLKGLIFFISIIFLTGVVYSFISSNFPPSIKIKVPEKYEDTITVYADKDYAPYSYIDENGNPQGYDVELIYMLAEEMEMNVDLHLIPWTMDLKEVDISDLDIILGLEYTTTYSDMFNLSVPVQINEYVAFGKKPFSRTAQLSVKKLGLIHGSIAYDLFIEPNHLGENVVYYSTYEEAFEAVSNGDIDYLIGRYSVGKRLLANNKVEGIKPVGQILTSNVFCFGVQKNQTELFKSLNSAIEKLYVSGDIHSLTDKWLGHHVNITSLPDFIKHYPLQIVILFSLISIILLYILLKRNEENLKLTNERLMREKLQTQLEKDSLTGGISYYKFNIEVKKKLQKINPSEYRIISANINEFKYINEVYGYDVGNKVLKAIAKYLYEHFSPDDLITRLDADKFVIFTKKSNSKQVLITKDYKVNGFADLLGNSFKVMFSAGIYNLKDDTESLDYMLDCANAARLEGKAVCTNSICYFTNEMNERRLLKNKIVSIMGSALENKEFYMLYQPKYCLKTGKCIGSEALIRWRTSDGQNFYPNDFIPIFESNGFIVNLDYYVMNQVCDFISNSELDLPAISINLSGKSLLNSSLVDDYCNILNKYNVLPTQIEIEITESVFVDNFDVVKNRINEFKNAGFKIAMDDFGTGVSSLNRLQNVQVDIIKLDKGFLNNTFEEEKGISIIKNILAMSKDLKIITVAEGVETKEQLELLQKMECDIGQGYYFSKPITQSEFESIIKGSNVI